MEGTLFPEHPTHTVRGRQESKDGTGLVKIGKRSAAKRASGKFIKEPAFRFIDLFAGIGGIRRAFETVGGRCVFI